MLLFVCSFQPWQKTWSYSTLTCTTNSYELQLPTYQAKFIRYVRYSCQDTKTYISWRVKSSLWMVASFAGYFPIHWRISCATICWRCHQEDLVWLSSRYFHLHTNWLTRTALSITLITVWKELTTNIHDWFDGFVQRYRNLSIRSAEDTSLGRLIGFSRSWVNQFFDVLASVHGKYSFSPSRIYNWDDTIQYNRRV